MTETTGITPPPGGPAEPAGPGDGTSDTPDDIALVRAYVVASAHDLVPELVTGTTVAEVLASVGVARAAWARVAAQAAPSGAAVASPAMPAVPVVPAGGAAAFAVDPATLPAGELIRRGIAAGRPGRAG